MNSEVLIKVENVSKKFCKDLKKSLWYGVKDISSEIFCSDIDKSVLRKDEFWALNNISFELKRGECLGLIGNNGAGKTTLLRLLNGLIKPDTGKITVRGKVGALIALGMGFNPILTGRENIFVNASILGISIKTVKESIDEIIEFSELEEFIDTPVQNYSTGMQVRLGFAIATAMKPDILLLDEVLAVGDIRFRVKCYQRIGELINNCAVVFVSHDFNQISRICNSALVIERGKLMLKSNPTEAVKIYLSSIKNNNDVGGGLKTWIDDININKISLHPDEIESNNPVSVQISYKSSQKYNIGTIRCNFKTEDGLLVADYDSEAIGENFKIIEGSHKLNLELGNLPFSSGSYVFSIAVFDSSKKKALFHAYDHLKLKLKGISQLHLLLKWEYVYSDTK